MLRFVCACERLPSRCAAGSRSTHSHTSGRHRRGSDARAVPRRVHEYDQGVPLLLFGRGVRPGVYETESSPADIAPTLAAAAGLDIGRIDGRALCEALPVKSR